MRTKSSNKSLHKAVVAKNDEFYTQLADIEKELKHFKSQFRDKIVYCNCDDPFESNFFKYFTANFKALGLKKLMATSYKPSPVANTQLGLFGDDKTLGAPKGRPKINANKFIINEVDDIDGDGAFDLRDIAEQLRANKNNEWAPLDGEGDFRSPESIELLKQADIVVTNPPFSLFREYVAQLMEHRKKFLIIGNDNAIKYKGIFEFIKVNKIWLGYGKVKEFRKPDGSIQTFGNVGWFTNLDVEKRHQKLTLYKNYNSKEYPKYDNFEAIEVSRVAEIPKDYTGNMGVPITFLEKHDPEQFEIVDMLNRYTLLDTQKTNEDVRAKHSHTCNINGKAVYSRIVIKNKSIEK
ncbi:MAG: adenine-specific methyltransferase EcoRI family protein [Parcubacteria group bacterium]|nr:adenine-specific methyltransferase EcoRI family protein [Parcubacteria group bacterium]